MLDEGSVNSFGEQCDIEVRGWRFRSDAECDSLSTSTLESSCKSLEKALSASQPNMRAIEEYRKKEAEYQSAIQEYDAVAAKRDATRDQLETLKRSRFVAIPSRWSFVSSHHLLTDSTSS